MIYAQNVGRSVKAVVCLPSLSRLIRYSCWPGLNPTMPTRRLLCRSAQAGSLSPDLLRHGLPKALFAHARLRRRGTSVQRRDRALRTRKNESLGAQMHRHSTRSRGSSTLLVALHSDRDFAKDVLMNRIVYLVGAVVIILFVLGFLGLR
jgi:hypothetical protein